MCNTTGLVDEQQKVRTISALAIAALAEAATPYGIESFDSVLKPLWKGIRQHRGKVTNQSKKLSIFLFFDFFDFLIYYFFFNSKITSCIKHVPTLSILYLPAMNTLLKGGSAEKLLIGYLQSCDSHDAQGLVGGKEVNGSYGRDRGESILY